MPPAEPPLDRLLAGLDAEQRRAVLADDAPLVILAPAGSGKTRVLSHRIARRVVDGTADAAHVLAITFTRRAAAELQRRLSQLGLRSRPTAGTFHGVAWSILAQRWADQGRGRPDLVVDRGRLLGPLLEERMIRSRGRAVRVEDVVAEVDWARARLVPPERYPLEALRRGRRPPVPAEAMSDLLRAYQETKRRRRLVDFDDLLELSATELARDAEFAAVQRWRFRHLFVDEFQDVNPLQFRLLEAWRGGRPDLCVVGDPNQAIYGWNGADPTLLARLPELVGGATVLRLTRTYRSTPQVVATATAALGDGGGPAPAIAVRPDGVAPQVHAFADETLEADGIARLIASRRPGRRWSACAVLVRTHAQIGPIERALEGAGIPTRRRHQRPLLDLPDVRDVLGSADAADSLRHLADEVDRRLDEALDSEKPEPAGLRTLLGLTGELLAISPGATVSGFRSWLAAGGADEAERADAVDVLTFHAAKGLEWPLVVAAGLEAGLVPHASATTDEARAEEARLLYVALSRAEHELHATWAMTRGRGARRQRRPSPLLAAVQAAAEPGPPAPPPRRRTMAPAADEPLRAALGRWRANAALAADVPEHAICSDDDLAALATTRPRTEAELAGVLGPIAARRLAPRLLPLLA